MHKVLADVVHIALHGGKQEFAARGRVALFKFRLQHAYGGFHHLSALQHFGYNQFAPAKQHAHLGHGGGKRAVDNVHGRHYGKQRGGCCGRGGAVAFQHGGF